MNALSRHAQAPSGHAALPFHPSCPSCVEQRALGSTEPDPLVSRRAATGAVVLALLGSGGIPTVVAAQAPAPGEIEGDSEGTGDADSPGDLVPPNVDLDGDGSPQALEDSPELPDNGGPEADVPDAPDTGDESTPVAPITPPAGRTGDESPNPTGQEPAVTPGAMPEDRPTTVQSPPDEVSPKKPSIYAPKLGRSSARKPRALRPLQQTAPRARETSPERIARTKTSLKIVRPGAHRADKETSPHERTHTVRPGETLWSIAAVQLGGHRPSPARVAAEVTRLWDRNEGRIGTGNPDMLMVGTVLELP
jgi:hypothetical protein